MQQVFSKVNYHFCPIFKKCTKSLSTNFSTLRKALNFEMLRQSKLKYILRYTLYIVSIKITGSLNYFEVFGPTLYLFFMYVINEKNLLPLLSYYLLFAYQIHTTEQPLLIYDILCYLCPHIFWVYYFSLSHSVVSWVFRTRYKHCE